MKFFIETERLILRDLQHEDFQGMYLLDSNVEVHKYLGNNPIQSIETAKKNIRLIQQQYLNNGIGRWATIEKSSGDFIGWSGLKLVTSLENNHTNYIDVGYRFIPKYWGKGYATEATKVALDFGFNTLKVTKIIGTANVDNIASIRVLEKCGLKFIENYEYSQEHICHKIKCNWMEINADEYFSLIHKFFFL